MDRLIAKIMVEDKEAAKKIIEFGFSGEDLRGICYDSLKDIFPGCTKDILLRRSNVWQIILADKESNSNSNSNGSVAEDDEDRLSSTSTLLCMSGADDIPDIETCSPIHNKCKTKEDEQPLKRSLTFNDNEEVTVSQMKVPKYCLYKDASITSAAKLDKFPKETYHHLVRGQISCMMSAASEKPFERFPKADEISEVATSLIIKYPSLKNEVSGHGDLVKQLNKRLDNEKQSMRRNTLRLKGGKSKKDRTVERPEKQEQENSYQQESTISELPPRAILKENSKQNVRKDDAVNFQKDLKANYGSVNKYGINSAVNQQDDESKEFQERRKWILSVYSGDRCEKYLRYLNIVNVY